MRSNPIDLEHVAAVMTLAVKPRDSSSIPFFVGASIPAERSVDLAALERLQTKYSGRLMISCGIVDGRLCIILPCPRTRSLEILDERARNLQKRIKNILGISACVAGVGYLALCEYFPGHPVASLYQRQYAEEGMSAH